MSAGLAEHAVVEEHARHALAPRRGVEHFLQAFVDHVAVALQREHGLVGLHALHPRRHRGGATVERLHHVDVEGAGERRVAADTDDADRGLTETELGDRLEQYADGDRLAAAWTEIVLAGL